MQINRLSLACILLNANCASRNSYLFYITCTTYSLFHMFLIGLQNIPDALHQLLNLRVQTLSCWLLQDFPDQLLCVSVALVVHHGRRPGPAGHSAAVAPPKRDLVLGLGGQCGLWCLSGRVRGPKRRGEESVTAALLFSRDQRGAKHFKFNSSQPAMIQMWNYSPII